MKHSSHGLGLPHLQSCNSQTSAKNIVLKLQSYIHWVISGKCLAVREFSSWRSDIWTAESVLPDLFLLVLANRKLQQKKSWSLQRALLSSLLAGWGFRGVLELSLGAGAVTHHALLYVLPLTLSRPTCFIQVMLAPILNSYSVCLSSSVLRAVFNDFK